VGSRRLTFDDGTLDLAESALRDTTQELARVPFGRRVDAAPAQPAGLVPLPDPRPALTRRSGVTPAAAGRRAARVQNAEAFARWRDP
jgi:hypothetical protein